MLRRPLLFTPRPGGARNRYIPFIAAVCLIALASLQACGGSATPVPTALLPTATLAPAPTATPVPPGPPKSVVTPVGLVLNEPGAAEGYTLFVTGDTSMVYLIDHWGRMVHTWDFGDEITSHAKLLENGESAG